MRHLSVSFAKSTWSDAALKDTLQKIVARGMHQVRHLCSPGARVHALRIYAEGMPLICPHKRLAILLHHSEAFLVVVVDC